MGVTFTHGCWDGRCTDFNDWRRAIASAASYPPLDEMDGFNNKPMQMAMLQNPDITLGELADITPSSGNSWEPYRGNPLTLLLTASDSAGRFEPEECGAIALALSELSMDGQPAWIQQTTKQFITGFEKAHEMEEEVTYS